MVNLDNWVPLANVRGSLGNTQKKNLRNDGESRCGWLNENHKSSENNPKVTKKQQPTDNQKDAKTEIEVK